MALYKNGVVAIVLKLTPSLKCHSWCAKYRLREIVFYTARIFIQIKHDLEFFIRLKKLQHISVMFYKRKSKISSFTLEKIEVKVDVN